MKRLKQKQTSPFERYNAPIVQTTIFKCQNSPFRLFAANARSLFGLINRAKNENVNISSVKL